MLSTKLDIWNLAISHLGASIEVGSENENTAAARACRRFYETCREKTLRDAPWPFARKYALLMSVTGTIPTSEYQYAYRYPADAIMVRRILNGISRVENRQSEIPFEISSDSQGWLVLSDVQAVAHATDSKLSVPWAEYTLNAIDTTKYSQDFVEALSLLLASRIGPRIAADKTKLRDQAFMLYEKEVTRAKINAFNEPTKDEEPISEFERSRFGFPADLSRIDLRRN